MSEPQAWQTVGRMLDISAPVAAIVREGQASRTLGGGRWRRRRLAVGQQVTLGAGGAPSIELAEQGFYSVRLPGPAIAGRSAVAVNLDPAESDLSALSPAEFLAGATGRAAVTRPASRSNSPELDAGRHREEAVDLVVPARRRARRAARRGGAVEPAVEEPGMAGSGRLEAWLLEPCLSRPVPSPGWRDVCDTVLG